MADNFITGTIGDSAQKIFVGTPGIPGTPAQSSSFLDGAKDFISNSIPGISLSNSANDPKITMTQSAGALPGWQSYFFRAVIIILGFIFLAVGLSMFKPGVILETTARHAKKALSK